MVFDRIKSQIRRSLYRLPEADQPKARIVSMMAIINAGVCLLALVVIHLMPLSEQVHQVAVGLAIFGVLTYLASLVVLARTGSFALTAHIIAASIFIVISAAVYVTGGYLSPFFQLYPLIPVTVFLIANLRHGVIWCGIVFFTLLAICILPYLGVEPLRLMAAQNVDLLFQLTPHLMALTVFAALIIHQRANNKLRRQLQSERDHLAHRAAHDPLTGLANKAEFLYCLQCAFDLAIASSQKGALIYIDLNDFKPINDNYGHKLGDKVIVEVAQNIRSAIRSVDTAARIGGDEFAVILMGVEERDKTVQIAEQILVSIAKPMEIEGESLQVYASLGIALFPAAGTCIENLVHAADTAMYQAKRSRQGLCFADELLTQ